MGPHSASMSQNHGNLQNNSNLPSNVEEDHVAYYESHRPIQNNYTSTHPIAIGSSTYSRGTTRSQMSLQPRNQTFDIAPKPSIYVKFREELARLETFSDWPLNLPVKKEDLARNGFIYLHVADRTQCAFCRGVLSSWERGDVVEEEHKRNCPECPMAFGYECGNKPIISPQSPQPTYNTTVNIPQPISAQNPNTYQHTYHIVPNRNNEQQPRPEVMYGPVSNDFEVLNRFDASGSFSNPQTLPSIPAHQSLQSRNDSLSSPKYPQWADRNLRVRSYLGWPAQMSQTPRDLADAGLLYMGSGDRCKCFWCGGELYDWEPQDEPMEEHAKWFSHCNYVRTTKGDAYIQYVKDKQNGLIVEPSEFMTKPHVLAVLQTGISQEQIEEVVKQYGVTKLISANDIIEAVRKTVRERQARLQELNSHNSSHHSGSFPHGHANDDDDDSMEIQVFELNSPEQTNLKDTARTRTQDSLPTKASPQNKPATYTSNVQQNKTKDVDTVLLENEKLKDQKLCKICMDQDLCMTFRPCNHLVTCEGCSKNLEECPLCRVKIEEKIKVFWS